MTKSFPSYDEAYNALRAAGFEVDYDPACKRQPPHCLIRPMTGASAGRFIISYLRPLLAHA